LLAAEFIRQGYKVIGLNTDFHKERTFYQDDGKTPLTTLSKDLRHVGRCRRSIPSSSGRMRIGVAFDESQVLNDSGTAQSTDCPLRDRHLRLAIHFRELGPAVSGETEEKPPSMAFVAAFSNRQDDKSSNKYHSC
jgi:hypothetical protein